MSEEFNKPTEENPGSENATSCSSKAWCRCPLSKIDYKAIYEKVLFVSTKPVAFFEQEKNIETTISDLYKQYFLVLAAIAPICGFIRSSIIGVSVGNMTLRVGFWDGLCWMVFQYGVSLGLLFLIALGIERFARLADGNISKLQAFKLVSFSIAPTLVAGVFLLFGPIAKLGLFVAAYSVYIFFQGCAIMGGCSEDKRLDFTAFVTSCYVIAIVIVSVVFAPRF